ncbi:MAG: glycoside hydrolase family 127 protein [Marinilabiliaceae bacterium]|nr:glycoside hydrolase family 127 protein [Marinilabiliaceae bacterium]
MKKITLFTLLLSVCSLSSFSQASKQEMFPLSCVRLLDGPFKHAQELSMEYILAHDVDRFLAPYRTDAGLKPKAPKYGNWESTGLDGHSAGHYLSGLSLMYAATGNLECLKRANYMVDEFVLCQDKNGNGYVGGIPDAKSMWEEIKSGKIEAENFSLNHRWVPWYNIHKLYAGLFDAYKFTGNEKAKKVLVGLCDWAYDLTKNLNDEQVQTMLKTEHGGMNEVFADVYDLTKNVKYLDLAKKFSHHEILEPLIKHEDHLNGKHANTQIPKVIGYKRVADVGGDKKWSDAANYFWDNVVNHRSVTIGGNSVREHFHPANNFTSMIESNQGPESCNTYNMLKLSKQFYLSDLDSKYIDYYEQATFNHILSTQHPEHGGLVYFTSMRPQHYRVYSKAESAFWCCVGTGMENHAKYGELIYSHDGNNLAVNLFIPSVLSWKEKNIEVTQITDFPNEGSIKLTLKVSEPKSFGLHIRYPKWVAEGALIASVNGKQIDIVKNEKGYFTINRTWSNGDVVKVSLPMDLQLVYLPDRSKYASLMYGPIVLGAATDTTSMDGLIADDSRMGHVANGKYYPLEDAPMFVFEGDDWRNKIEKTGSLTFDVSKLIYPEKYKNVVLKPFYQIHDSRYMVYWQCASIKDVEKIKEKIKKEQESIMALEAKTVDQVAPGEQQPESDHFYKGDNTNSGVHQNRHWRDTRSWFSYDLKTKGNKNLMLQVTYYGRDANRNFDIVVNDRELYSVCLKGDRGDRFFTVDYPISSEIISNATNGVLTVKFKAREGSIAGGIFYVRLLKMK